MKIVVDRGIKSFEKIISLINGFDEVEFLYLETQEISNDKLKDTEALFIRSTTLVDKALLKNTKIKIVGSATAGSWIGGYGPIPTANAQSTQQEFNGSAWSTGVAMPGTGVPMGQTANGAPNDDYWLVGMSGTYLTGSTTAQFDGSAWTTATNAPLTTSNAAGGGTDKSSGYLVGGYVPGPNTRTNATQEFSGGAQVQTITTS